MAVCTFLQLGFDGEDVHAVESGRARGRWIQRFLTTTRSLVGDQGGGEAAEMTQRRRAPHGEIQAAALS